MFPNCPQNWLSQKSLLWNIRPLIIHFICFSNIIFHHSLIGTICFNHNKLFFFKHSMLFYKSAHLHTWFLLPITCGPSLLHSVNYIHQSGFSLAITSRKLPLTAGIRYTYLMPNSFLCLFLSNHSLSVYFKN